MRPVALLAPALAAVWLALAPAGAGGTAAAAPQPDAPGCTDPASLPRPEGARILGCEVAESDEAILPLAAWNDDPEVGFWDNSVRLEGRRNRILYALAPGRSPQEVLRGYRKALTELGYEVLFECSGFTACGAGVDAVYTDEVYGKRLSAAPASGAFAQDSVREPRILVAKDKSADGGNYVFILAAQQHNSTAPAAGSQVAVFLEQIASRGPEQHLVLLRSDELAQGLDLDGHVPVYGIRFDPDGAQVTHDSDEQLAQIARLLRERPALSLHVVGHTDDRGGLEHNLDLSRRRAEAVVAALVRDYAIAPERLRPQGLANLAPVAPNTVEEGRARNRRIELVAQ
jgi:OmpA-OmpF porin, OOP family